MRSHVTALLLIACLGALCTRITHAETGSTVSSGNLNIQRTLTLGTYGEDVSQLQQFLKDLGYFTHPTITGYFGIVTYKSVEGFQQDYGLEPVGIVGPRTRGLIAVLSDSKDFQQNVQSASTTTVEVPTCPAPPAFTCIPGTSIVQPWAPGNGYTPGFGGGGAAGIPR